MDSSGKNAASEQKDSLEYSLNNPAWKTRLSYCTFICLGGSNVVPWMTFLTSLDFFVGRYPEKHINYTFPVINMAIIILSTLWLVFYGHYLSLNLRTKLGLYLEGLATLAVPLVQYLAFKGWITEEPSYQLTVMALAVSVLGSALAQSACYGMGAILGGNFTQALEAGKGWLGLLLILLRIPTKAFLGHSRQDQLYGLYLFFASAVLYLVITLGLYLMLMTAVRGASSVELESDEEREVAEPREREEDIILAAAAAAPLSPRLGVYSRGYSLSASETLPLLTARDGEEGPQSLRAENSAGEDGERPRVWRIVRKIRKPACSVFLVFVICLSCFPGLTTDLKSTNWHLGDWFPVVIVAAYNVGDLVGKTSPAYVNLLTAQTVHYPLFLDLFFVPIFLFLASRPMGDLMPVLLVLLLGLVTGYVGTSCMMIGPTLCSEKEREVAGVIMSLCLLLGLLVGSLLGMEMGNTVRSFAS